ncbi:MAG: amidohydrolase family protein [Thermaerobacter sp.]|nr:amidohydrolase family protein [Thermaerobacter sp.]
MSAAAAGGIAWETIRALDAHVHLATAEWVEDSMGPYLPSVEAYFRRPLRVMSLEEMVSQYRQQGVAGILLAWDAERNTRRPPLRNERVAEICRTFPDVFLGFGSVDPGRPDALQRLDALPALGLRGLKLHPTMQGFDPLDERFGPFFARAADLGLRLLVHTGTSGVGAREPGGQGLRLDLAQPIRLDALAARHPAMPILLAHVGWPWHLESLAMALHKRNVFLDISGWRYRYLPDEILREMKGRLQDQVLFGTDFPMFSLDRQLDEFQQLGLPAEISRKILVDNARSFLGLGDGSV